MKRIITILIFAALAGLWNSEAFGSGGGSTTYYYATVKAQVSTNSSGMGKVYAGTSSTAGSYSETSSTSGTQKTETSGGDCDGFYLFAQPEIGYQFDGWSESDNATSGTLTKDSPYKVSAKASAEDGESKAKTTTYYANFSKMVLPEFSISFSSSGSGEWTVNGNAPANIEKVTEVQSLTLASSDGNFLCWEVNGTKINDNPYTFSCTKGTTVVAKFLTAEQCVTVDDYTGLDGALNNASYLVVTIPSDKTINIDSEKNLIVPAGKKLVVEGNLVVEGSLAVCGTLTNNGVISGNGKVMKVVKDISQGEVITPTNAWTNYPAYKYRKTTVTSIGSSIAGSGSSTITTSFGVSLNNEEVFPISKESPKALLVNLDKSTAINSISKITGDCEDITSASQNIVLLQELATAHYVEEINSGKKYNRFNGQGVVDCAGKKFSVKNQTSSNMDVKVLNGTAEIPSSGPLQNGKGTFINCSSVTLNQCKNKPTFYFYDCGTVTSPAKITTSNNDSVAGKTINFYSGYYDCTFGKSCWTDHVYGGSFKTDPSSYLDSSTSNYGLKVVQVDSLYEVQEKEPVYAAKIGEVGYLTLQAAIEAATDGAVIKLDGKCELTGTLVIPEGKAVTIDLAAFDLTGGEIVNNGKLRFEDNSRASSLGVLSTPVVNKTTGTIDINYGNYAGSFTLDGGRVTAHYGTFTKECSFVNNGGTLELFGGTYSCDIDGLLDDKHRVYEGYVGEYIQAGVKDATINDTDYAIEVTALTEPDYSLYRKYSNGNGLRSDYSNEEWDRLSELKSMIEPIENDVLECSVTFDRDVKAGTFSVKGVADGITKTITVKGDCQANIPRYVLCDETVSGGYTPVAYKYYFTEHGAVKCGIKNGDNSNIGATITIQAWIRVSHRATGYTSQNPVYDYTYPIRLGTRTHKFTGGANKAMIDGGDTWTLKASLSAAISEVAAKGNVKLANDCDEVVMVSKECTIDLNGFDFTGTITAGDGYVMGAKNGVYSVLKKAVGDDDDDTEGGKVDDNGFKAWQNLVVENTDEEHKTEKIVSENKEVVESKVDSEFSFANLEAGKYKREIEITNDKDEVVETLESARFITVMKNTSEEQDVIIPIPGSKTAEGGKVNIANVIDQGSLSDGDVISFYMKNTQGEMEYKTWEYNGGTWSYNKADSDKVEADEVELPAGGAFWLKRADVTKPVVVVAQEEDEVVKTEITDDGWNLVANPNPTKEFDLNELEVEEETKDEIVVPTAGLGQKTYTKKNGKWGYTSYRKEMKFGRETVVSERKEDDTAINGGVGFWYISNDTEKKPTIDWSK